jgi:hypothetical protein
MPTFHIVLESTYPETIVEEIIEIEAASADEAVEAVLDGDGYQLKTSTCYGESDVEVIKTIEKA